MNKKQSKDFRLEELRVFKNFAFLAFDFLNLKPSKLQYEFCDVLQYGPRRQILEAWRGFSKSYITAIYCLWTLYWNPSYNILIVSASKNRSDSFSQFCFKLLKGVPQLNWMLPTDDQRFSALQFDISAAEPSQAASVVSMGIYGQLTGLRADLVIADDVEVPKTSDTQGAREKLVQAVTEFESILKPHDKARIVFLGTPQCEDSLYNALAKTGYKRTIWPVRVPNLKWMNANGHELARSILEMTYDKTMTFGHGLDGTLGRPVDDRFTEEDLLEREAKQGKSNFSLQFMLDTTLSDQDRYPLRLKDLLVMNFSDLAPEHPVWSPDARFIDPELDSVGFRGDRWYIPAAINGNWSKFESSIMAIDPAGTGKDETSYMIVKCLNGILYLCDAGGLSGGSTPENLEILAQRAKHNLVHLILIESNFGDGMFNQLLNPVLRRIYPCNVQGVKHSTQKEKRIIDTLEPIFNTHKLIIKRSIIEQDLKCDDGKQLFRQITRITKERGSLAFDDKIDCLAMAVSWFKDKVNRDAADEVKRKKQKAIDKEINDYHRRKYGKQSNTSFLSGITRR
jgi:hypothetical protein